MTTRVDHLTTVQVADWFARDARLVLPVGGCGQHGPHLPVGTDNIITLALSEAICDRTGILLAPLLPYGVAERGELATAGTAALERKTLHRVLNELVECWEKQGLEEITLLTGNASVRHIQALAMVLSKSVRVRSVDTRAVDVSRFIGDGSGDRAGEFESSLMMYIAPAMLAHADGDDGFPPGASAEKGRRIYEYLVDRIVERIGA
jgi:creatinine amidohydrolase